LQERESTATAPVISILNNLLFITINGD